MNRIVSELRRRWIVILHNSGLPAIADRRIARRVLRAEDGSADHSGAHLLIAPPGDGNLGDQAIFEAFVEGAPGPVLAIVRDRGDLAVPAWMAGRVEFLPMANLIYGEGKAHAAAVASLTRIAARSASLSIIGADTMDGRYSVRGSIRRSTIAYIGGKAGIEPRIISFSWNAHPRFGARRALARASRAGAIPMLRDPTSAERARQDGVVGVRQVADIVFAGTVREQPPVSPPRPYAIVNVSGLINRTHDQTDDMAKVVEYLRGAGIHVVILPHVVKTLSDDLVACAKLAERVGEDGVTFVRRLLAPAQIRSLAGDAEITITGRMHLAVMSLMGHTPAVTLATQGKVEGLMELFHAPELCLEPNPGFAEKVIASIQVAAPAASPIRTAIEAALPRVIGLAQLNTDGLGSVRGGGVPVAATEGGA